MKIKLLLFFVLVTFGHFLMNAQSFGPNKSKFRYIIQRSTAAVVIDGALDEPVWQSVQVATNLFRILPIDTGQARAQTEIRMTYDDTHLYLGILCHDPWPGKRPAESLRRDFSFGKNDNFIVFMDTYNDRTNGFAFGLSAAGAQWDGQQANGGFVSLEWEGKWRSAVKNYEDRWVAEMAIPFRTIRYKVGVKEWGINFSRLDLKGNEKSSWAPMPRQFQTANLAYAGTLVWDNPPPDLGTRYSFIPYLALNSNKNNEENEPTEWNADAGFDAKVTLSPSMNLDLTVNPDFSQVEVDRQVINLDRFELFFPERRQFFLENSDLFASLGTENIRPFFSRRIGLTRPPIAGMRLSGRLDQNWRLGIMNMQTTSKGDIAANNFLVATVQRQMWQNSNLGLFLVNKSVTGIAENADADKGDFNRVAGFDFNLASRDNKWTGKAFYHRSFTSGNGGNDQAAALELAYQTQYITVKWQQSFVGENYAAETGFIQRTGIHRLTPSVQYKFYPASQKIANHGPLASMKLFYNTAGELTDRAFEGGYQIQWLNRSNLEATFAYNEIKLLDPFDPTNTGGALLPEGTRYRWQEFTMNYNSDTRKLFNYEVMTSIGDYFNGDRFALAATIFYRVQPWGSLAITSAFNRISLPDPYADADLFLIGPRLDLTFTNTLFLTTFVQYNNQIDNINVNTRFQWRFAPASDLFVVYTSNYLPDGFKEKDRAFAVKVSYWLN